MLFLAMYSDLGVAVHLHRPAYRLRKVQVDQKRRKDLQSLSSVAPRSRDWIPAG